MTLKLGFIGTGNIAGMHLKNLQKLENATVSAFCDLQLERAEQAAQKWPDAKAYSKITEMLDDRKLDAVYICLPPIAHGEVESQVIERGLPFLVEKPLGINKELPHQILAKVSAKKLITAAGYQLRYLESAAIARKILQECTGGMALGYRLGKMPPTPWWGTQSISGGQFVEQTTHIVDLLRYTCGEVEEVYAAYGYRSIHEKRKEWDIADVGTVTMKLNNGMVATISNTCMMPIGHKTGLEIYTDQGMIEISGNGLKFTKADITEEFTNAINASYAEDEAFLYAVQTGDTSRILCDYADAIITHEITIAANESAASGKPVKLTGEWLKAV
jgi:predicted dehydrogenase